jgi:hypothetical protein
LGGERMNKTLFILIFLALLSIFILGPFVVGSHTFVKPECNRLIHYDSGGTSYSSCTSWESFTEILLTWTGGIAAILLSVFVIVGISLAIFGLYHLSKYIANKLIIKKNNETKTI